MACRFVYADGDVSVKADLISSGLISCQAPPSPAGAAQVQLLTGDAAHGSEAFPFYFHENVNSISVQPASGPVAGGTVIAVQGAEAQLEALAQTGQAPDVWCRVGKGAAGTRAKQVGYCGLPSSCSDD